MPKLTITPREGLDGKWLRSGFVLLALSAALCGCKPDANQVRLKDTATALAKAADACLLDVRDKKLKYDKSPQCDSLRSFYLQHLGAGGFRPETPAQYALIAAEAKATAWSARAISEAGNVPVVIW